MIERLSANSLPKITFKPSPDNIKSVTIETPRLTIRSVTKSEQTQANYECLFGDEIVMKKYATGDTKDSAYVQKRISTWVNRWSEGDPFSGFSVYEKDSQEFMGTIVLGHGDIPGESELAFLFLPKFWGRGYGKEAVSAILENYAPELARLGIKVDGVCFNQIVATAKLENEASNKILSKFMNLVGQEQKYGATRNMYSLKIKRAEVEFSYFSRITTCIGAWLRYGNQQSA